MGDIATSQRNPRNAGKEMDPPLVPWGNSPIDPSNANRWIQNPREEVSILSHPGYDCFVAAAREKGQGSKVPAESVPEPCGNPKYRLVLSDGDSNR